MRYSPGTDHARVPRARRANLRFRRFVSGACERDAAYRPAVLAACRDDILFFVNVFVWQFNPNACGDWSVERGPFVTMPVQEDAVREILWAIEDRHDLVIEKSREMGASWLCLIVMVWFVLFHPDKTFLCVSRNAEMVDKVGRPDCLFWKIDFIIRHLPEWMADAGSGGNIRRRVMSIWNRHTESSITGQATTEKMGVGGRATAMFLDEFSQVPNAREVFERTADTTACRIFNGTHKGTGTMFHELATAASAEGHVKKLVMHWSQHPDKGRGCYRYDPASQRTIYREPLYEYKADFAPVTDGTPTGGPFPGLRSPWYDAECVRRVSARGIAADLDINPTGSVEQVFDPLLVKNLKDQYVREGTHADLEWLKSDAEPVRFHHQAGGPVRLWCRLDSAGLPPPGRYVFGADIAQGLSATPSCLSGADARTGEKVFAFASASIEPKDFAYFAVALCRLFRGEPDRTGYAAPAHLVWEVGGPGNTFGKHVVLLGHRDIYLRRTEHSLKSEVSDVPGWANQPDSLMNLILSYRDALRNRRFLNRDSDALDECLQFRFKADGYVEHAATGRPKDNSSARVNHGDRVIADALTWKRVDELKLLPDAHGPPADPATARPANRAGTLAWRRELATMGLDTPWV